MIKPGLQGWRARWTVGGTIPLAIYGAWLRSAGLHTPSLRNDAVWVAALCKASLPSMLAHGSSSPPLFDVCVALCIAVLPDPEVSAQLFPFVCSILAICAVAWATLQVTTNPACATFAAALYACDPLAVIYAARVKQYSSDALISAIELGLVCLLLRRPTRRLLWGTAAFMVVGLLLSTVSLFVVAGLLPIALLALWRRGEAPRISGAWVDRQDLRGVGVLVFAACLTLGLAAAPNPALVNWWRAHYLPTDSLSGFSRGVWAAVSHWPAKALHDLPRVSLAPGVPPLSPPPVPGGLWIGLGLAAAGAITLGWPADFRAASAQLSTPRAREVSPPGQRPLLLGLVAVVLLVLFASAIGRFPLEGVTSQGGPRLGRVELFLAPLVACLLASGLLLTQRLRQRRWRKLGPLLGLALAVVQLPIPRTRTYIDQFASTLVERMAAKVQPGDSVWTNQNGSYWLAYYGRWAVTLEHDSSAATAFHARLVAPDFQLVTVEGVRTLPSPSSPRVYVFLAHTSGELASALRAHLGPRGYSRCSEEQVPGAKLLVFLRD